jgi:hypothetical protein
MLHATRASRSTVATRYATRHVALAGSERLKMWFLASVVKSNRYFESDSQIGNRVLLCDSTDMIISGRAHGENSYRFEARKGNESYTVAEFNGPQAPGVLTERFLSLAKQFGAVGA